MKQETRNKKQETRNKKQETRNKYLLLGGEQKHQSLKTDGICTCLCSAMGTGGGYIPLLIWIEK